MHTFSREMCSLPIWLLREYLEDLGGQETTDGEFRGDGWHAQVKQVDDFVVGALRVGRVLLDWQGNDHAYQSTWPKLEQKLLRAGG